MCYKVSWSVTLGLDSLNGALRPSLRPQRLLESCFFLSPLRNKTLVTLKMNPLSWQNTPCSHLQGEAELGLISTVQIGKLRPREEEGQDRQPGFLLPKFSSLLRCSPGPEQHVIENWAPCGLTEVSVLPFCLSVCCTQPMEGAGREGQLVCLEAGRWLPRPNMGRGWVPPSPGEGSVLGLQGPVGGGNGKMAPDDVPPCSPQGHFRSTSWAVSSC